MADPTVAELVGGTSATATTTASFSAQTAGTLLILHVAADDYRTLSGSGRPESTGWTFVRGAEVNLGCYVFYKLSAGSETSVQYTLGGAAKSAYAVTSATNIDQTTPLDNSGVTNNAVGAWTTYVTSGVTTTSGRRIVFGTVGAAGNNAITGMSGWTNSYTEIHDRVTTSGYRDAIASAYLIFDGGGTSANTTATFSHSMDQAVGITSVFRVADAAAPAPGAPILNYKPAMVRAAFH